MSAGPARAEMALANNPIGEAVASAATLADVDRRLIGRRELSRDARDAMWRFAWTSVERRQIRRWARAWKRRQRPDAYGLEAA
jgi:hypothetical protein